MMFCISSGIPQGSNLGLFLSLLFINDVLYVIYCQKCIYVDDFNLYTLVDCIRDCQIHDTILNWICINAILYLMPEKLIKLIITFYEYGSPIWYPLYSCHKNNLESIQRRILKCLAFKEESVYLPRVFDHTTLFRSFKNLPSIQEGQLFV